MTRAQAMHGVNVLLQLVLVIELFVNLDAVQAAIAPPDHPGKYGKAQVHQILMAARWLLLFFLVAETAALVMAAMLRFWIKRDGSEAFNNFDADNLVGWGGG